MNSINLTRFKSTSTLPLQIFEAQRSGSNDPNGNDRNILNTEIYLTVSNSTRPLKNESFNLDHVLRSMETLRKIGALEENWNGNNAPAFSSSLIEKIKHIVKDVELQPFIFPTARESIQLEYEKENGDYLEFEIFKDHAGYYSEIKGQESEEDIPEEDIPDKVREFYAADLYS